MIMNYQLMAGGFLPISIAKENRLEYYEAPDTYAVSRNLRPFAEMVAALEEQRLDEYLGIVCGMDMEGTDAGLHLEMPWPDQADRQNRPPAGS